MIDPLHSLAFSIQANPRVHALLLGSGVSRSAGVLTGWEIVLDLIRQRATINGVSGDVDLEQWYIDNYHDVPNYSRLLKALANTPSECQLLLRSYFEPSQEEQERGLKEPTAAHRAIASLVAKGFIKVIVTTNFDRLIEKALEEKNIVPTVLSTADQIKGALPLIHNQCCVFKIHGDYLDVRIRNTPDELSKYPRDIDKLLNQIFDEFGIIICGWSGEWDIALRNALFRTKSKRFTTYWASRHKPSANAEQLIIQRDAQVINITNADTFFESIQQTVESIEDSLRPHPLSIEASVANLKLYLSKPEHKIRLMDLVGTTIEDVVSATSGEQFNLSEPTPDKASITARVRLYDSACSQLAAMAPVAAFWADEENFEGWEHAILRLSTTTGIAGHYRWLALRTYPGRVLLYSLGIGLVESRNLSLLNQIFSKIVPDDTNQNRTANILNVLVGNVYGISWQSFLEGMESNQEAFSRWLHDILRQPLRQLIPDDQQYTFCFDKFEVLLALGFAYKNSSSDHWFHPGEIYISPEQLEPHPHRA